MKAYIFITTSHGKVRDVIKEIKGMKQVRGAHVVAGCYDIIVLVEAEDISDLKKIIEKEIQRLEWVVDTNTSVVVE